ncbi:MAG TPA: hypothetical protein VF120_13565, partial [Ktedonobacterales bacterium]
MAKGTSKAATARTASAHGRVPHSPSARAAGAGARANGSAQMARQPNYDFRAIEDKWRRRWEEQAI